MPVKILTIPVPTGDEPTAAERQLSLLVDSGYVMLTAVPVMTGVGQALCAVLVRYPRMTVAISEGFTDPDDTQPYKPIKDQ